MDFQKSKVFLCKLALLFWAFVLLIYFAAGEQFRRTYTASDAPTAVSNVGAIFDGTLLTQRIALNADRVIGISVMMSAYGRTLTGALHAEILDSAGNAVAHEVLPLEDFSDDKYTEILFSNQAEITKGDKLTLRLWTEGCAPEEPITIFYGNMVTVGRFDIVQNIPEEELYTINGQLGSGRLCVRLSGMEELTFYRTYWVIVTALFLILVGLSIYWWKQAKGGRSNPLVTLCTLNSRYSFLLRQLIVRDFKAKYKRSALGMAWSFLNPLLSMAVQYIVFSTLFKSNVENYPVYLLTGIVFFNFFTEAVNMGMTSITGNGALIKKVFIPKTIYPLSKVLSSLVNFALALLPLFMVMLITGTAFRPALFLLLYDVVCLLCFVMGMVLLLSTMMTFFQDTQFLWGVASMLWMYLTPIFYTEDIIPAQFLALYHMNPLYQYITFARMCVINGASPEPMAYLWCLLSAVVVLTVGAVVFKRHQDQFVLYL